MSDNRRWRVGRSLGRTIYIQKGDEASKSDTFVGLVETRELAKLIVDVLNDYSVEPPDEADEPGWDERTQDAPGRYGT